MNEKQKERRKEKQADRQTEEKKEGKKTETNSLDTEPGTPSFGLWFSVLK